MLKILKLTRQYFRKQMGTVKFWVPFILAFSAVYDAAAGIAKTAAHYLAAANGFSAAFLLSDKITVFTLFIGIFILFSELPFKDAGQMFLIVRSGKRAWIFSQVLYIISVSAIYFAFVFGVYCLILTPNLNFDAENWGKLIKTIAAANVSAFEINISIPLNILSDFLPLEGFLFSFGTAVLISVALGMIILALNLTVRHNSGIIGAGILIFLYMFVSYVNAISHQMFYFSPLGWCSLVIADKYGRTVFPDIDYIVGVLTGILGAALAVLLICGRKRAKFDVSVREEIT